MTNIRLKKREFRQKTSELRALLCEWDPIGVMDDPECPRDEYDCLIGPVLKHLGSGGDEKGLATFLRSEIEEHFGLSPEYYDFPFVARRVVAWFDLAWRYSGELETIYVALFDEGVDVWRPVQARPVGQDLFRIVGVDSDVRDEIWEFPVGAVVKCEVKESEGSTAILVAKERVSAAV